MKRRNLLRSIGMLPLLSGCFQEVLSSTNAARAATVRSKQRVRPSGSSWPSAASWAKLKDEVGGNLIEVHSLFGSCRSNANDAACLDALKDISNPYWIGDQPAGTEVSGWLDAWTPAPSAYAIKGRHAADVAAGITFARANNLRLVVKGGGHSYLGTSNAPDSLLIWTRSMNKVVRHDAFVGEGCEGRIAPVPAVSAEAGAVWMDLYNAVTPQGGRYVQGGGCLTVGRRCSDPDLFWALKGGGGGTFGVVTRLTLRTHELPKYFGGAKGRIKAQSDEAFTRLIAQFVSFYHEKLFNPQWGEQIKLGADNVLEISMTCHGLDDAQAAETWRPFFDWVKASPQDFTVISQLGAGAGDSRRWWAIDGNPNMIRDTREGVPRNHAWNEGDQGECGIFLYGYDSLWLPASLLQAKHQPRLVDALFAASRHKLLRVFLNKGLAGAPFGVLEATRQTATNPAVVEAFALVIIADGQGLAYPGLTRTPMDLTSARRDAQDIDLAAAELRKIAPNAGSYVSESNYFNRSWQKDYWGANYSRLRAIKTKYDPDGLFFVHHGVGSEEWSSDGFTRLA
jgi:FAD/FMN-containing dehydrogenase